MKHFPHRQTGMTFISILLLLGVLACFVTFGLRLFPLYNEHLSIKAAMTSVLNQPASSRSTLRDTRLLFLKNADINNVYVFNEQNINDHLTIKKSKDGKKKYLHMDYENSNNLFKNIYLTVKTDVAMEIPEE